MIHILWAVLLGFLPVTIEQSAEDITREVNRAILQGNARTIARHFGQNVDLFIPGSEGSFSKAQSEIILRDFFSRHTPESFTVENQRSTRDGTIYVIGTLKIKDGTSYRTYYVIKRVSGSNFLHLLRIDSR